MPEQVPPPYIGIDGVYVLQGKHGNNTNYDTTAKPGQILVNSSDYSVYVGNSEGDAVPVGSGGGAVRYYNNDVYGGFPAYIP